MKRIIVIILALMVNSLVAQTDRDNYSSFQKKHIANAFASDYGENILVDNNFISTLGGSIDTVWQHIEAHPGNKDVITNRFFAASDGSFYFASERFGGFLTKINSNGGIEWTIDRNFSGDTSIKYCTVFQDISELSNGDIIVYGSEDKASQNISQIFPIRFIISPSGIIKEEINTRNLLPKPIPINPIYHIFPDTRIYLNTIRRDSLSFFSLDTSFTKILSNTSFKNDYSDDPYIGIRGAKPYNSSNFIFAYLGTLPKPDTIKSTIILQFSKEYKIINRLVIHTGGISDVGVYNDGSYMILSTDKNGKIHTAKYDTTGNQLWQKEPKMLQNFALSNFNISKAKKSGFFVTGESYPLKANGSINYFTEERIGYIIKLNDSGECEWYYKTGRASFRNTIQSFAEASDGDVVFVCNSLGLTANQDTPMQITRLRPKTTGVTEQPSSPSDGISIYPNPTSTTVTISGIEGSTSIRIMNSLGMEVISQQVTNEKAEIDITNLANGMYFASIRTATGVIVKPIVVSH